MARHTKKKRSKPKRALDQEVLGRALAQLPDLSGLNGLKDLEAVEVAKALVAQGERAAAERFSSSLTDRDALRAVKRALFVTKQLGGGGSRRTARVPDSGRQMMGAPGEEGRRIFTFTWSRAGGVHVVEAYFSVPEGLFRLQSSPTQLETYDRWAREMMGARDETSLALPRRVQICEAMLSRKRWEISDCLRHGRLGDEVDEALLNELGSGAFKPEHPLHGLSLSATKLLSARELLLEPHAVRSFFHEGPMGELNRQWEERGATALISSGSAPSAFGVAIDEWLGQWGTSPLHEHICDLGYFYAKVGRDDLAATFRSLVSPPGDLKSNERVSAFLTELMVSHFS